MKRWILGALAALVLLPCAFAQTGYVRMIAANLTDQSGSGSPISNATACFQLVNAQGTPIGVHIGSSSGGQAAPRQACGPVNNGALIGTWQVSDPTAAGTNLVPDPVITSGFTTWNNPGGAWSIQPSGGTQPWNVFEVTSAASGLFQASGTAPITVVPGQTYTLSGFIAALSATSGGPAWLVMNTARTIQYAAAQQTAQTNGYVYTQFTVPAGVTQVEVVADTEQATIPSGFIVFESPLLQAGSARLVDTNLSNPINPCYQLTITDNTSGNVDLGGPGSGYTCLQPQWTESTPMSCVAGVCNLDSYTPTGTPGVTQTVGPVGPAGPGANFRGNWAASTAYANGDIYNEAGTAYVVTSPYTSGSTYGSTDTAHNATYTLSVVDSTARTALTGSAFDAAARVTANAALPLAGGNELGTVNAPQGSGNFYQTVAYGDSLTAGVGAITSLLGGNQSYPYFLAYDMHAVSINMGVAGATSQQIAITAGGVATTVTLSGNQIPVCSSLPCSGITATFPTGSEILNSPSSLASGSIPVTIAGVAGLLTENYGTGVRTFTPTQLVPSAVSVPSGSAIAVTSPLTTGFCTIWGGVNDGSSSFANVASNIAAIVATPSCSGGREVVVSIPYINSTAWYIGGATHTLVAAVNASLAASYGAHFVDFNAWLAANYKASNAQDVADVANGVTPSSFRGTYSAGTLSASLGTTGCPSLTASTAQFLNLGYGWTLLLTLGGGHTEKIFVTGASVGGGGTTATVTSCTRGAFQDANYGTAQSYASGQAVTEMDSLHMNATAYNNLALQVFNAMSAVSAVNPFMTRADVQNWLMNNPIGTQGWPKTGDAYYLSAGAASNQQWDIVWPAGINPASTGSVYAGWDTNTNAPQWVINNANLAFYGGGSLGTLYAPAGGINLSLPAVSGAFYLTTALGHNASTPGYFQNYTGCSGTGASCLALNNLDLLAVGTVDLGNTGNAFYQAWLSGGVVNAGGAYALPTSGGQTSHQVIGTCGSSTSFGACAPTFADIAPGPIAATSFTGSQTGTITAQAAAGSGATVTGCLGGSSCSQAYGMVQFHTGTGTTAGNVLKLAWPTAFSSNAVCEGVFTDASTVTIPFYTSSGGTTQAYFATTTALTASTTFYVVYHCGN